MLQEDVEAGLEPADLQPPPWEALVVFTSGGKNLPSKHQAYAQDPHRACGAFTAGSSCGCEGTFRSRHLVIRARWLGWLCGGHGQ